MIKLRYLLIVLISISRPLMADDGDSPFYQRYDNEQAAVNASIDNAKAKKQLVALVLGAQWCHDSRALANYFQEPNLQPFFDTMTVLPLDVGYLENKQSLLQQFGYPAYFATPTMLIIDPVSKQVINRSTLPAWQNAHNESAESLLAYLQSQQAFWQAQWQPEVAAETLGDFETQQASILYSHYQQLGKLLAIEDTGGSAPRLNEQWRAVKKYRMALQDDLIRFHQQGKTDDKLPRYSPINW